MFYKISRSLISFICLPSAAAIFTVMPVTADGTTQINAESNGQAVAHSAYMRSPAEQATLTTPATPEIANQSTSDIQTPAATSNLTPLVTSESEEEEPLSWWLITIIVAGGLLIILVTWRLIRRAGSSTIE